MVEAIKNKMKRDKRLMTSEEKMYKSIRVYEMFNRANIVCVLSKKQGESIFKQYIFTVIPFIFCLVDWLIMYFSKTLYNSNEKTYAFIDDLSDSFGLTILFLVSYFLSGYYQRKVNDFLKYGIEDNTKKQRHGTHGKLSGIICLFIGLLIGTIFFISKVKNYGIDWLREINVYAKLYHGLLIGITWYNSLTILGMATFAGFMVYWSVRSGKLHYIENLYNKNISIIKAFDILACTLSYGFFYIIGAVLIILNDNIATRKYDGIEGVFSAFFPATALIVFICSIVILEIIPLIRLWAYMKEKKIERIKFLNDKIEQIDMFTANSYSNRQSCKIKNIKIMKKIKYRDKMYTELEEISCHGVFNDIIKSRILMFSSFIIPLTGVVIQAINVLIRI